MGKKNYLKKIMDKRFPKMKTSIYRLRSQNISKKNKEKHQGPNCEIVKPKRKSFKPAGA